MTKYQMILYLCMGKDVQEQEKIITAFLRELQSALEDKHTKFRMPRTRLSEADKKRRFTNHQTLQNLEYNDEDIKGELKRLRADEYYHSVKDDQVHNTPYFRVFIKEIKSLQIYIKVKLVKVSEKRTVVCLSFHEVEYHVSQEDLPYHSS